MIPMDLPNSLMERFRSQLEKDVHNAAGRAGYIRPPSNERISPSKRRISSREDQDGPSAGPDPTDLQKEYQAYRDEMRKKGLVEVWDDKGYRWEPAGGMPTGPAAVGPVADPTYAPQVSKGVDPTPKKLTPADMREATRDEGILINVERYMRQGKTRAEALELVARNLLRSGHFKLAEARNRVAATVKGDLSLNPPKQALGSTDQSSLPSFKLSFLTPTPEMDEANLRADTYKLISDRATAQSAPAPSTAQPNSAPASIKPTKGLRQYAPRAPWQPPEGPFIQPPNKPAFQPVLINPLYQ